MRYIIFVPAYDAGGISSYCGDLANELIRRGRNVLLVIWVDCSSPYSVKKKEFLENLPQIWVELDSLDKSAKIARQLSGHLGIEDNDILCGSSFPWISALVTRERKMRKIFHIEFIHGDSEGFYDHAIRVYNSCDLFVVMSQRMERNLKKHLVVAENIEVPCIICPAGIVAVDTIPIRSFDIFRICYVGRLDPILKRVYDLVELIKKLLEYKTQFQFTIIGGGVNVLPDLINKIADLGADSFVEVTGLLPRKEILKYLRENHAIILTSSVEGFPVALCEGMGQGVIPVATRVSGIEDVITDGVNGFLADIGDTTTMAQKLNILASNSEMALKMSRKAWETARSELQISTRIDYFERKLKGLVNASTRSLYVVKPQLSKHNMLEVSLIPNVLTRTVRRIWRFIKGKPVDAAKAAKHI